MRSGGGLSRYGAVFVTRWIAGIQTLGWLLLLVLPGLYKALAYSLAGSVALFEDTSGNHAVGLSIERTRPHLVLLAVGYGGLILASFAWSTGASFVLYGAIPLEMLDELGQVPFELAVAIDALVQVPMSLAVTLSVMLLQVVYERTTLDAELADAG
jgi:hypothetical protein